MSKGSLESAQEFDGVSVIVEEVIEGLARRLNVAPEAETVFMAAYKDYHNSYHGTFGNDAAARRIACDLKYFTDTNKLPYFVLATYFPDST